METSYIFNENEYSNIDNSVELDKIYRIVTLVHFVALILVLDQVPCLLNYWKNVFYNGNYGTNSLGLLVILLMRDFCF